MKLTVDGVEYEKVVFHGEPTWFRIDRGVECETDSNEHRLLDALAAAEQSRAAQVVEIASLRADRDRCADSYQQEKAARIVAEAERDRWRKLATDARPYVDTSPDWLERFDAEAGKP